VQVHRKKVDLMVTVATSTLHPRQDGPFTLYDKRGCKIELEVAIPRDVINAKDVEWVERALGEVAQKFETERAARGSDAWNGRGPDEYPDDYEMTLARHAVWKAEETNRTIEARIDASLATAETIAGRVKSNTFYLAGFAAGTKVLREWREHDCGKLIGGNFASVRRKPSEEYEDNTAYSAGFSDGQQLVYSLALVRRLPGCYVDVPPLPEEYADAGATTAQR
jgi:hypothetical protein